MTDYLFFMADRDGEFDGYKSLSEHLAELDDFGGTPDCWDWAEAVSAAQARRIAEETGEHLYVVSADLYRVVGHVNDPDEQEAA